MFATDKCTVCGGGGGGQRRDSIFIYQKMCVKNVYGDTLLSILTSRLQPAVGRAKHSEIRQRKSNRNLVPCCYC